MYYGFQSANQYNHSIMGSGKDSAQNYGSGSFQRVQPNMSSFSHNQKKKLDASVPIQNNIYPPDLMYE